MYTFASIAHDAFGSLVDVDGMDGVNGVNGVDGGWWMVSMVDGGWCMS